MRRKINSCSFAQLSFLIEAVYASAMASLIMPNTFGDKMILPAAPKSSYLHGKSNPGEAITVTISGAVTAKYSVSATHDGKFSLQMKPYQATSEPSQISIRDSHNNSAFTASDVLWGDLYVCSGQSNMGFPVRQAQNASDIIAAASNFSNIRLFKNPRFKANTSLFEVQGGEVNWIHWNVSNKETLPDFSAVCYLYAVSLVKQIGLKTPIGLIESDWGNTDIRGWSPGYSIAAFNDSSLTCSVPTIFPNSTYVDPTKYGDKFYGMISPHRFNPVKGWLWYQGEHNSHKDVNTPANVYECWFRAMITTWRHYFKDSLDTPLLYVQLSDATKYDALGSIRDAQRRVNFDTDGGVKGVAMAVSMDIGTWGTVHPTNKIEVGRRLALTGRSIIYGDKRVHFQGPQIDHFEQSGKSLIVYFTHADGLRWNDTNDCHTCCNNYGMSLYATTGLYGKSANVSMTISKSTLLGTLPAGFNVSYIRYGFALFPQCVLMNSDDLPGGTFMHPPYRYPPPYPKPTPGHPYPITFKVGGKPNMLQIQFAGTNGTLQWSDGCQKTGAGTLMLTDGLFGSTTPLIIEVQKSVYLHGATNVTNIYSARYQADPSCFLHDSNGTRVLPFEVYRSA